MNKAKKGIALLTAIAIVGMLALSACGNKTEPEQPAGSAGTPAGSAQVESVPAVAGADEVVGDYKLFAIGQGETYYSAEEYGEFMKSLMTGLADSFGADEGTQTELQDTIDFSNSILSIKDDGTASLTMFGTAAECAWSESNGTLELSVTASEGDENSTITNGSTITGTFENGIIRLTDPDAGSVMVFAAQGADTSGIKISSMQDALGAGGETGK